MSTLRAERESRLLSRPALARLADVHECVIARTERGYGRPRTDAQRRLLDALGLPVCAAEADRVFGHTPTKSVTNSSSSTSI